MQLGTYMPSPPAPLERPGAVRLWDEGLGDTPPLSAPDTAPAPEEP